MVLKAQCSTPVQGYELLQEGLFSATVWEDVEKALPIGFILLGGGLPFHGIEI